MKKTKKIIITMAVVIIIGTVVGITQYKNALNKRNSDTISVYVSDAEQYMVTLDFENAIASIQKALDIDKNNPGLINLKKKYIKEHKIAVADTIAKTNEAAANDALNAINNAAIDDVTNNQTTDVTTTSDNDYISKDAQNEEKALENRRNLDTFNALSGHWHVKFDNGSIGEAYFNIDPSSVNGVFKGVIHSYYLSEDGGDFVNSTVNILGTPGSEPTYLTFVVGNIYSAINAFTYSKDKCTMNQSFFYGTDNYVHNSIYTYVDDKRSPY